MHLVSRTLGHNAKISYDTQIRENYGSATEKEHTKNHVSGTLELGRHDIKLIHTSVGKFHGVW